LDSIGSVIDTYFARKKKLNHWQIKLYSEYDEIVGKTIASNTKISWIQGSSVTIACRNSVWINELRNLEEKIIDKINSKIGKKTIDTLVFKIGNIEIIKKPVKKKIIVLSKEEEQWIMETKRLVPSELEDKFESLLRAFKELKKA